MMLRNLNTLPIKASPVVENFFQRVESIFSGRVDSIYLYGSVVTQDYQAGKSDINSLVLVDRFQFDDAKAMQPVVKDGLKHRVVAPLILGLEMFERSVDTFPLEFIQIQENHVQIFGEPDRVAQLVIPRDVLRLKIEEQIKGKLIRLREVFMEMSGRDGELIGILDDAQRQLFPVFRNFIRFLSEEKPPVEKEEILRVLEKHTQHDFQPCRRVFEHQAGRQKISKNEAVPLYGEYVELMVQLGQRIDQMEEITQ